MANSPTAVRFPPGLLPEITAAAQTAGIARNAWIVAACRTALTGETTPGPRPAVTPMPEPDLDRATPVTVRVRAVAGRSTWQVIAPGWLAHVRGVSAASRYVQQDARDELAKLGHHGEITVTK